MTSTPGREGDELAAMTKARRPSTTSVTISEPLMGGIIAAGEGSRLRRDGFRMPKPLVPVAGVPLIDSVIRNFTAAGITRLVVIVNDEGRPCVNWVRARWAELDAEFIVRTTASSLESFAAVLSAAGEGRMLISTVDAWCAAGDFARFVEAARGRPREAIVLGVTPFVDDERPLWVDADDDGRVRAIGEPAGRFVTAGLYLMPERIRRLTPPAGLGRLRHFLAWLHTEGEPMYAEAIATVIDVDRAADVALAEAQGGTA